MRRYKFVGTTLSALVFTLFTVVFGALATAGLARFKTAEFEGPLFIATAPYGDGTIVRGEVTVIAADAITFNGSEPINGIYIERALIRLCGTTACPPVEIRVESTFDNVSNEMTVAPSRDDPKLWNIVRADEHINGIPWRVRYRSIHVRWSSVREPQLAVCEVRTPLGTVYKVRDVSCFETSALVSPEGSSVLVGTALTTPGGGRIDIAY